MKSKFRGGETVHCGAMTGTIENVVIVKNFDDSSIRWSYSIRTPEGLVIGIDEAYLCEEEV